MSTSGDDQRDGNKPTGRNWRDDPIANASEDRLDRAPFAVHAAKLVDRNHSSVSSVVYGLEGPWGSGKSSAVSMIAAELRSSSKRAWRIVHFTPWATTGTDALFEEFFSALSAAVPKAGKGIKVRRRLSSYADIARPVAAAIPVVGAGLAEASRTAESRLRKPWNTAFAEVSADLKTLGAAILVVVDDIDRLQPSELLDLLKVVRLLGRFPGVDFLLAYDERTVVETLQDPHRSTSLHRAREFMEKIVQYPLSMPPLLTSKIVKMLDEGLTEIVTQARVESTFDRARFNRIILNVMPGHLPTPRAIGRFLAQVELQFAMHDPDEIDEVDLILATFVRLQFPDVFANLQHWKPDLTYGTSAWIVGRGSKEGGPDWDGRLRAVLADDRSRADARIVLETIFPAIGSRESKRARSRRFAHPDYFDRYLAQAIPQGDIPDREISDALQAAANGMPTLLRAFLLGPSDDEVALAASKIRARYPDVAYNRPIRSDEAPLTIELLSAGMQIVDELRDRRDGWTSELAQIRYWTADLIRLLLHVDPQTDLTGALSFCSQLDRRAHVVSTALSDIDQLSPATQQALRVTLAGVARDLFEPLLKDLRARDESEGFEGSPWLYGVLEEAGLIAEFRSRIASGLAAGEFTDEDLAARLVGFAYVVGGSGQTPSSASFSGAMFTDLTGVPARSADHADGDWPDTSWERRRAFAASFIEPAEVQPSEDGLREDEM